MLRLLDTSGNQRALRPLTELKIAQQTHHSLSERLDHEIRRFDYDPRLELLVIRMPSPVHDFFSGFLAPYLHRQLESIASRRSETGNFALKVKSGRSSRILLQEGTSDREGFSRPLRRQPEAQFQHKDATYLGAAVEISYLQDGRDLRKLAQDYILYSNGDIKLVYVVRAANGLERVASHFSALASPVRPRSTSGDGWLQIRSWPGP